MTPKAGMYRLQWQLQVPSIELKVVQEFNHLALELQPRRLVDESEHDTFDDTVLCAQNVLSKHRIGRPSYNDRPF